MRGEIRKGLEETKKRRDAFLVHHRELFEALLPERNYIARMIEKKKAAAEAKVQASVEVKTEPEVKLDSESKEGTLVAQTSGTQLNGGQPVKPEEPVKSEQPETIDLKMGGAPPPRAEVVEPKEEEKEYEVVPYKLLDQQPEG